MRKLVALASFVIAACIVPIPNSAGATCLTESECSALLAIMEPNIQVLRGKVATSKSNASAAIAARNLCNALDVSTVALAEAKNNCINIATDASLSATEGQEFATAKLQEAIDQQATIRSQLTKIVNENTARAAAAAEKTDAGQVEVTPTPLPSRTPTIPIAIGDPIGAIGGTPTPTPTPTPKETGTAVTWLDECELSNQLAQNFAYSKLVAIAISDVGLGKSDRALLNEAGKLLRFPCKSITSKNWSLIKASRAKAITTMNTKLMAAVKRLEGSGKSTKINCYRNGSIKIVSGIKPKCPTGYKLL